MTTEAAGSSLFDGVIFAVVPGPELKEDRITEIIQSVEKLGGVYCHPRSDDGRLELNTITHIISATTDFADYTRAIDGMIPVVTPDWVRVSIARKRLVNTRQHSPDPNLFFSGVNVCCSDLPPGDEDAVIGGVLAMGGMCTKALTKQVTHLVALTEEDEKCQAAVARNMECKIVLPHWFDDCLRLGRRIDEQPYILPDPEIMHKSEKEPIKLVDNKAVHGACSPIAGDPPVEKIGTRRIKVFQGKSVMLSADLGIGSHLRGTIEDIVVHGGGRVTGSVHRADIFVCQYREGHDYVVASRAGKDVGNLAWLYYLMAHDRWTSPMRRLLHYPMGRGGLPGFKGYKISLSNYGGEARIYLENLIRAAGAEYTKTMKQDNTHLITAHSASEKCDAAKEWNMHMINHLWLEESYARWEVQSLTHHRYTHFPARTNLGEVVGQTQIDRAAVQKHFYPTEDTEMTLAPEPEIQSTENPTSADKPLRNAAGNVSFSDSQTPRPSKTHQNRDGRANSTPGPMQGLLSGKENETPSSSSSRGAKERAVAKLHDLAPDIALYEKEKKRVGGVIWGGKRAANEEQALAARKRSLSRDTSSDLEEEGSRELKRAKKSGRPPVLMRLSLSGYSRWHSNPRKEDEEKRHLRDLGIIIVQDPSKCTHLAAPSIVRTQKFICGLASGHPVLSTDFVDHCLDSDEMPSPEDYLLNDPESEKLWDVKLERTLALAQVNKGRLLRGKTIYCTQSVRGGFDTYKAIVDANGGTCLLYRARAGSISTRSETSEVPKEPDEGSSSENGDDREPAYLISSRGPEDKVLWTRFRQMAQDAHRIPKIVETNWLLSVAMSQEMKSTDNYELLDVDSESEG